MDVTNLMRRTAEIRAVVDKAVTDTDSSSGVIRDQVGLTGTQEALLGGDGALNLTDNAAAFQAPLAAAAAGTGGGAGGELAFTGGESTLLATAGMAMVLAGGAAVIVSRRRD